MPYRISRLIEIDAGHRIPDHKSKCFALHGHRYRVEVGISSKNLQASGAETGMIKDYGFLKSVLMKHVHDVCDHRMMLHIKDPLLEVFMTDQERGNLSDGFQRRSASILHATSQSFAGRRWSLHMPIVVCSFVPTAENLAEAWYNAVSEDIKEALGTPPDYIKVWETPNTTATYVNE